MAKAKRAGTSFKGYYAKYKTAGIHDKNALRRLQRDLKNNPGNEEQVTKAIKNVHRTRCTPKVPFWNSTRRREAGLYKTFTGFVNKDIFSNNEKVSAGARMTPGPYSAKPLKKVKLDERSMFSLGTRARWDNGTSASQ